MQRNGHVFSLQTIIDAWIMDADYVGIPGAYRTYTCPSTGHPTTLVDARMQLTFQAMCRCMGVDTKFPLELQHERFDGRWSSCQIDDQLMFTARLAQVFATRVFMVGSTDNADIMLCNQELYLRFSVTVDEENAAVHLVRMHGSKRDGKEVVKVRVVSNDQQNAFFSGLKFAADQLVIAERASG